MFAALLGVLSPVIDKVLDFIPNPVERAKAKLEYEQQIRNQEHELTKLLIAQDNAQIEVNKVEAANSSIFVSGWRPFVGWVCGFGVCWAFVLQPLLDWILAIVKPGLTTPIMNTGELMSLLLGLLGMGAIRSFEKVKGVANK